MTCPLPIPCQHWSKSDQTGVGICAVPMWTGMVSAGTCAHCLKIGAWKTPELYQVKIVKYVQPEPLPRDQWPLAATALAALTADADTGLGDTLRRCLKSMGIAWIVAKGANVLGKECGCANRRAWLNARYPFKSPEAIARDIPNG